MLITKWKWIWLITTPKHHEGDGQVERLARTVMNYLRACLEEVEDLNNWFEYLPIIQYMYNTTPHPVTKFSPHFLIFLDDEKSTLPHANNLDERKIEKIRVYALSKERIN